MWTLWLHGSVATSNIRPAAVDLTSNGMVHSTRLAKLSSMYLCTDMRTYFTLMVSVTGEYYVELKLVGM